MAVVAEHDSSNERGAELPPVLPHQLFHIDMCTFVSYVNGHCKGLKHTLSAVKINRISDNLAHLQRVYREETVFKAAVDANDIFMDFPRCCEVTSGRFSDFWRFCGDFATAFPNTATVESDLSVLGWENDDYHIVLTDFSLKSILHWNQ